MKSLISILTTVCVLGCASQQRVAATRPCCEARLGKVTATGSSARSRSEVDPAAAWGTDSGKDLTLAELRGQPCVITFFFAHCAFKCPLMVENLRQVQASLPKASAKQVRFVLITLDPVSDTPETLRAFRAEHRLSSENWFLLRGSPSMVRSMADQLGYGFHSNSQGGFDHDSLITVLGAQGDTLFRTASLTGGTDRVATCLRTAILTTKSESAIDSNLVQNPTPR